MDFVDNLFNQEKKLFNEFEKYRKTFNYIFIIILIAIILLLIYFIIGNYSDIGPFFKKKENFLGNNITLLHPIKFPSFYYNGNIEDIALSVENNNTTFDENDRRHFVKYSYELYFQNPYETMTFKTKLEDYVLYNNNNNSSLIVNLAIPIKFYTQLKKSFPSHDLKIRIRRFLGYSNFNVDQFPDKETLETLREGEYIVNVTSSQDGDILVNTFDVTSDMVYFNDSFL